MTITAAFDAALARLVRMDPAPARLPHRLATAARLGLDAEFPGVTAGVGVGLYVGVFHVCVAATGPEAAVAQDLQFTLGEGPGPDAHRRRLPVLASGPSFRRTWPVFYEQLTGGTPFRSVLSIPLTGAVAGSGTVDVYSEGPLAGPDVLGAAMVVAARVSEQLECFSITDDVADAPQWLANAFLESRLQISIATGMLMGATGCGAEEGLLLLRGRAFAGGIGVTELAAAIVTGEAPLHGC
ncbi:hypothetical protein GIS00_11850 [Nakamurella sp. YIM 132087]|uniref:ANTAR domain-containing protein n=1 Tax=Nakamurella alba TaxID=2665158 RepID=A0A7K1FKL8_9ACTN|nr:ANTAR domain-containing protein [Nakamurella alba]MTD14636.1 hypothetical protein [Nakamurella alba]